MCVRLCFLCAVNRTRTEDVFKEGRLSVDAKGNPLSDAKTDRFPRMVTEDFSPLTAGQSISDETGSFHI